MRKRAERRWTVMLVPHGSGASRAVEVSHTVVKGLLGVASVIALVVEQMSHAAKLFRSCLQSFDLLAQLSLFRLFLTQHLVDIPHGFDLLIAL